ncbi:MAG: 1-acyl-sn-glycerol-3-phosphate acyltransferase [Gammaproteobacteria bacterium]
MQDWDSATGGGFDRGASSSGQIQSPEPVPREREEYEVRACCCVDRYAAPMGTTVTLPLWLVVILVGVALWALVARVLVAGARWYLRRRANKLIGELNRRLDLEIPPIALAQRHVLIDRLVYDPKVMEEVSRYCEREHVPRSVAVAQVRTYAREVAPAFNAYVYFRVASWLSKRILEKLYRVRLGHADERTMRGIDANASVVLVMNHRSNVDYVLVTYLVLERVAISYAVGEWARVWPLQQLVRLLGAYFVRRNSGDPLYRRVLERYVQMAVEGGVTQAIFPEGGLSRDGRLRRPKIGLLDYMLRDFDTEGQRDIVFVPVSINYDRVLEDRTLLLDGDPDAERKTGARVVKLICGLLVRAVRLKLAGKLYRFGYACANFGTPISLREYARSRNWQPKLEDRETRVTKAFELADHLMEHIAKLVPVLPVSLLAVIFLEHPERRYTVIALRRRVAEQLQRFEEMKSHVYMPRRDPEYFVEVGLRMMTLRRMVEVEQEQPERTYKANEGELRLLAYYANAIEGQPTPWSGRIADETEQWADITQFD